MAIVFNRLQLTSTMFLAGLFLIGSLVSLSSCTRPRQNRSQRTPAAVTSTATSAASQPLSGDAALPPQQNDRPADAEKDTVSVTLYKADSQCENFVPEQVQVSTDRPIEAAVGELLADQSSADFELSGYRVSHDSGEVTVDLRLSPNSRRKIVSLSACEQFALFGSIRETLTRNSQWQVNSVRFTERGKAIVF